MNPETDTSSPPPPVRNRRAPRYLWFRLSSLLCVVVLLSSFAWTHWKGEQILEETRDLARYDAFTERWCGALLAVIAAVVVLFLFWKRQWNRDLRAGLVVRKSAWAEFTNGSRIRSSGFRGRRSRPGSIPEESCGSCGTTGSP